MTTPIKNYGPEFLADLRAEAEAEAQAEAKPAPATEELRDLVREALSAAESCGHPLGGASALRRASEAEKELWAANDRITAPAEPAPEAEPLFWYRPCGDGMYEGPHHHKSVGGAMLREEKPGEWVPLFGHAAAPAAPAQHPDTKDAERWRWVRNEAWGGGNKCGPYLVTFKPGYTPSQFTMLAEEAADGAIDAAIAASKENTNG